MIGERSSEPGGLGLCRSLADIGYYGVRLRLAFLDRNTVLIRPGVLALP